MIPNVPLGKVTGPNAIAACLCRFTLPLLNTTLFPLIVILRKPVLRKRYLTFWKECLCLPLRVTKRCCNLVGWSADSEPRYVSLVQEVAT